MAITSFYVSSRYVHTFFDILLLSIIKQSTVLPGLQGKKMQVRGYSYFALQIKTILVEFHESKTKSYFLASNCLTLMQKI